MNPSHQRRRERLSANFWWIFAVIGAGSFLGPLSGSIVNVVLPSIARGFSVDVQSAKWIVLGYLMINTVLLPIVGKLGQKFGEARIYTIGFAIYCLGSITCALCSFAADLGFNGLLLLVAARALQACGSALLFGVGSALVTHYVPAERRGLAFGLIGSIVGIALVSGPVLGGALAANFGWPWIFWALVPVTLIGLAACLILLPLSGGLADDNAAGSTSPSRDRPGSAQPSAEPSGVQRSAEHLTEIPAISSMLWVVIVVSATLIGEAFSKGLWLQYLPLTLTVLVFSVVGFAYSERLVGRTLFDYSLFRIPVFRMGALINILIFMVIFALIIFLPFYLEEYSRLDLLHVGLMLSISPLLSILIGPASGHIADRIGYRIPVLGGLALSVCGYALMALAIYSDTLLLVGISLGVMGIGGAVFHGPVFAAMMGSVSPQQRPLASSFGSLTSNLGFLSGTSLSAIAFGLLLWRYGGRGLMVDARTTELALAVDKPAFLFAFGGVLVGCAAAMALALALAWRFPNRPV
ncbi:MAG: MFS transporter [bacterium]|nr:MFS transporter [bacterium]